jgi:hypothetical protein
MPKLVATFHSQYLLVRHLAASFANVTRQFPNWRPSVSWGVSHENRRHRLVAATLWTRDITTACTGALISVVWFGHIFPFVPRDAERYPYLSWLKLWARFGPVDVPFEIHNLRRWLICLCHAIPLPSCPRKLQSFARVCWRHRDILFVVVENMLASNTQHALSVIRLRVIQLRRTDNNAMNTERRVLRF